MRRSARRQGPTRAKAPSGGLAELPLDRCVMLRRNPQYVTPRQMEALKASIQRDGFLAPILVRRAARGRGRYEIISGNHRVMAARELGMATIPALICPTTISNADAARLAVNLNTIHGDPIPELLAPFLAELDDDILRTVHLEAPMLEALLHFDDILGARLKELQAPQSIDIAPESAPVPHVCICPRCGRTHTVHKGQGTDG